MGPRDVELALARRLVASARDQDFGLDPGPVDPPAHTLGDVSGGIGAEELEEVDPRIPPEIDHAAGGALGQLAYGLAVEKQVRGCLRWTQRGRDGEESDEQADGVGEDLHARLIPLLRKLGDAAAAGSGLQLLDRDGDPRGLGRPDDGRLVGPERTDVAGAGRGPPPRSA